MKKTALLFVGICLCSSVLYSQDTKGWIDVTQLYINNPDFNNNNADGWTYKSDASSQRAACKGWEFWYGSFNIQQTAIVPNGKYRLSVQAYYRTNGNDSYAFSQFYNGTEDITAYLFANEDTKPLVSIYSEYLTDYYSSCFQDPYWGYYYPTSVESGAHCFELGMYNNYMETEVTNGELTIGIFCESWQSGNWCMMDNFKLEYYGNITPVEEITVSQASLSMIEGETQQLSATITPSNATFLHPKWSSSEELVATVDKNGLVTAHNQGEAYIYAEAADESGVYTECKVTVKRSVPTAESLVINEVQAANIDMFVDPSFNYGGWIELYNPTMRTVGLNGLYISDDEQNLTKHRLDNQGVLQAGKYHVLWFDHYHHRYTPSQIDFKLDYDGGTVYISDQDGQLITSCKYPAAITRTSYARTTNGGDTWGYTADPTPGRSNENSVFASERIDPPIVDTDARLFTSPFTVNVMVPLGATLRYTTDGTTPTLFNGYTSNNGTFQVNTTTTYRFRLFKEGKLPSQVITRTYIYQDKDYTLPIISVVTDPVNLYDDSLGVYVRGVNGRPGNGQSSNCNWNMDWDRPVNFEYITPDGDMVVNQEVDFAMCGGWSRANEPHSFKLKAAKIYEGNNSINYPFFSNKPFLKHKTLQNRNGGNDNNCRLKDAALQEIVHRSGLDVDGQSTQPIVHFLNGKYIGLLNMREPNNKHFAYANYGIDTNEMDQFEMSPDSGYVQMEGTRDAFLKWYNLSANAADVDTYEAIRNLVDIDEYINYMAVEFYLGGVDWPQNNIKAFRPRIENGRFRFVLYDLDGALATSSPFNSFESRLTHTFDYIYETGERFTEEIELVTIFLNMLSNDTFRKQFIDSYCLVAGSVFESKRCNEIIDEMAERIASTLAYEGKSPYSTANSLKSNLSGRQSNLIRSLINYSRFKLYGTEQFNVAISANVDNAPLRLNNMIIPTSTFAGSLFAPITLRAEEITGQRFVGWSSESNTEEQKLIKQGSEWEYYDQGSLDREDWTSISYPTGFWNNGTAPFGYHTKSTNNERGYNTFLDYGDDANNKRPTYYFRNTFTLSQTPTDDDVLTLKYMVDDGMVVYVNGIEAARYLMPNNTISYNTYASTYANNDPDNGTITLPTSLLNKGKNIIAIEVHNTSASSSDIYFDAELIYATTTASNNIICENNEYILTSKDTKLKAIYEPLTNEDITTNGSCPVRINEISADNSIYINEYYKKNDWIELFNTTSEPIDVAGMYLSDNIEKPTKYQITAIEGINTVIEPYSHLIIWADKLTTFTQLHAPFKLATEGGHVILTAADQSWNDVLYYEPHLGTESVGLYPDGSNDVYIMTVPTIAQTNIINSYAAWLEQPERPDGGQGIGAEAIESLHLSFADNTLHIVSSEATSAALTVYSTTGQQCLMATSELLGGHASISLRGLPEGTYIVSVTDSNGVTQTMKLKIQ